MKSYASKALLTLVKRQCNNYKSKFGQRLTVNLITHCVSTRCNSYPFTLQFMPFHMLIYALLEPERASPAIQPEFFRLLN